MYLGTKAKELTTSSTFFALKGSFSGSEIRRSIVKFFLENKPLGDLLHLQKEFERNIEPVRHGKKYEGVVK